MFKKEKCDLCNNKLPKNPYMIEAVDENDQVEYTIKACDECGLLLSRISEKAYQVMSEIADESV